MENTFGKRLAMARKIRGMSQRKLSEAMQGCISASAIAKYEKGMMMPSSSVLIGFADALQMNLDFFFRPFTIEFDDSQFEFRKNSALGKKKTEEIKTAVKIQVERYAEIEGILCDEPQFVLDYSNVTVESESDAVNLALRFRKDVNIGTGAIVSATEMLESVGCRIIETDAGRHFSGTTVWAGRTPVVVVNNNMTSERKRLTMFHELGHLLMRFADGVNKERMCNIFANEVLIPSEKFKDILGATRHDISVIEMQAIQREYGISIEALMMKARSLNVITERRFVAFSKKKNALPEFKTEIRRSLYPDEHTDRFERLVYRAVACEAITESKASALLNIPIGEVRASLNLM